MELSGSQILMQFLKDEGVEYIFGYPGGAVLHIYDEIYAQDDVKHILVRHEQGATHMADGYARATGKPGVVLVTSGAGCDQRGDRHRHRPHGLGSDGGHHRTGPDPCHRQRCLPGGRLRRHHASVREAQLSREDVRDLADTLKKAFYVASTGRPGPVVVDIPKDVTAPNVKTRYEYPASVKMRSYNPVVRGHPGQMKKALDLILSAKRPMSYTAAASSSTMPRTSSSSSRARSATPSRTR